MKYLRFISLIIFSALLLSCSSGGGGGGGGDSSGTSDITLVIGSSGSSASIVIEEKNTFLAGVQDFLSILSPAEAVAGEITPGCYEWNSVIPWDIDLISFSINGVNVLDVSLGEDGEEADHCNPLIRTFTVQNGANLFAVAASGGGEVLYTGSTPKIISGNDSVQIIMQGACTDPSLNEVSYSYDWNTDDNPEMSDQDDDNYFVYNMPWSFPFYGKYYNQITVDSNGNIWFEHQGYGNDFDLADTGGYGPVIAAWNNDLNSEDYYGAGAGYMVLHKTDPERIVIRWETATYDDDDYYYDYINEFEIVLYPNGNIRIDYNDFDCDYCDDNGSGISKGNGSDYISLTNAFGDVYTLGQRSFLFSCETIGVCVPTLVSPAEGAIMDNGGPDCQDPMIWNFDWSDCPDEGATYDIQILGGELPITALGRTVSNHTFNYPIGIIPDFHLTGWTWQVRATEFGQTGAWSQPRFFTVEPTNTDCTAEPVCGDGNLDPLEECDDGNTINGDGCDAFCTFEPEPECFTDFDCPEEGMSCVDGICELIVVPEPVCGDGYTDPDEECDDGNTTPGDGCENDCTITPASECPAPSIVMHPNVTSQLGGALNVDINGRLYDATFYNQWSLVSPKQQYAWAENASLALYNLFHTSDEFDPYDSNPAMVWGCDRSPCMMVTPLLAATTTVRGYAFDNADRYGTDRVQLTGFITQDQGNFSFVQWTESECQY